MLYGLNRRTLLFFPRAFFVETSLSGWWTATPNSEKVFNHQIKALESLPPTVGVQCTSDKVGVEVSWFGKVQDAFQNRKSGSLCINVVTIIGSREEN